MITFVISCESVGKPTRVYEINVRKNRRDHQQWTIQRHCQHLVRKTQNEDKQSKYKTKTKQHRRLKR